MKYTIETIPYTQPYHYTTIKEAKRKQSELSKQGKKSHIICVTENGNDYILVQHLNIIAKDWRNANGKERIY